MRTPPIAHREPLEGQGSPGLGIFFVQGGSQQPAFQRESNVVGDRQRRVFRKSQLVARFALNRPMLKHVKGLVGDHPHRAVGVIFKPIERKWLSLTLRGRLFQQ